MPRRRAPVEIKTIEDLQTETPLNLARLHSEDNLDLIASSLKEVGAARSIVIDEAGSILAGKGTTLAAARAGITKVRVIDAAGDELIAVRRTGLSKAKKIRLALFDNRASETSEWDTGELQALAEEGLLEGIFEELPVDEEEELFRTVEEAAEITSREAQEAEDRPAEDDLPPVPDALFPSEPEWGIPMLDAKRQARACNLPALIWGSVPRKTENRGTWLFYTEDYRYSALWKDPNQILETKCLAAVEPNFSCYAQMPRALALWRIFQKRWLARYWQENGVQVFADLNVNEAFYDLNLLGIPAGWRAYATRGYSDRIKQTHAEHALAVERAGTDKILFVVYGGGAKVKAEAARNDWIWIPEVMDVRKGKEEAPHE